MKIKTYRNTTSEAFRAAGGGRMDRALGCGAGDPGSIPGTEFFFLV